MIWNAYRSSDRQTYWLTSSATTTFLAVYRCGFLKYMGCESSSATIKKKPDRKNKSENNQFLATCRSEIVFYPQYAVHLKYLGSSQYVSPRGTSLLANGITLTTHYCRKCITGVSASGDLGNCISPLDFNLCWANVIYCKMNRNSKVRSLGNITVVY